MSKVYRKSHTPTTKKALLGVDDKGNLVYNDTGLPVIRTQSEFMRDTKKSYTYRDCIACNKQFGLDTDIEYQRCHECRVLDDELENKMKRLARLSREGIVPEDTDNPFGVKDASWKPNGFDVETFNVHEDTNKLCSTCFIVLPKSFGRKRLCESCRKD